MVALEKPYAVAIGGTDQKALQGTVMMSLIHDFLLRSVSNLASKADNLVACLGYLRVVKPSHQPSWLIIN